jgi:hypothetical protein
MKKSGSPVSPKHILLHVQDSQSVLHTVRLVVNEENETGAVSVRAATGARQQQELTRIKKSKSGDHLNCRAGGATVSLSLRHMEGSPELRVLVSLFFTVFNGVYSLDESEYQRLAQWIRELSIGLITQELS